MTLRAIFYSPTILEQEEEFKRFIQSAFGTLQSYCIEETANVKQIAELLEYEQLLPEDVLYLVWTKKEWEKAKELNLAVLCYVPQGQKAPEVFSKEWIVVEGLDDVDFDFLLKVYERAHDLPWTVIETSRLILREFSMADLPRLFELYEKPGVTDYMEPLYEYEKEREYEQAYISNMYRYYGYGMWLVCLKETGKVIGRAGLEHREYEASIELEMGYMIEPEEQKKGYATEACEAIVRYAAENLEFERVCCLIEPENEASIHLVKKLGFKLLDEVNNDGKSMLRYTKYCFF